MARTSNSHSSISNAELATLKELALKGDVDRELTITCSSLADELDVSPQTVSRRLRQLDQAGLIDRTVHDDGQNLRVSDTGLSALRREYEEYRRVFDRPDSLTLQGVVATGMGEGKLFVSLSGYKSQFVDRLGYEPFEGTLNVELGADSTRRRSALEHTSAIPIDGWEEDERTYGPAACYPASLVPDEGDATPYEPAHVVVPERTHHDEAEIELLAPDELRDCLTLDEGDRVTVHVQEH
jgi:riboflavin kinase